MALESKIEREGMSKKVTVNKNTAKMVAAGLAGVLLVILGDNKANHLLPVDL